MSLAALLSASSAAHAAFPCESIAIRGDVDPEGDPFTNKFDERVGVNGAGDVVFVGRAGTKQQAVYLYEDGGPHTIVAQLGEPAPGGSSFMRFGKASFGDLSINTDGDVAFFARLALPGAGVFVRDDGVLQKVAQTGDTSPAGGTFDTFPSVSQLNDSDRLLFVAGVDGGPDGIFAWDDGTIDELMTTADTDDDGNPFCSFQTVGYSDGVGAFIATVGIPNCGSPVQGVYWLFAPGDARTIVRVGDATPTTGVYTAFQNAPETSSTGISFAASIGGDPNTSEGIFLWDGTTVSSVAKTGDIAPVVNGLLKKLGGQHQMTLADQVYTRFFLRRSVTGQATFRYGGTPVVVQAKSDIPPSPPFGGNATYRAVGEPAVDEDGDFVAFYARVRDSVKPGAKDGILRCTP